MIFVRHAWVVCVVRWMSTISTGQVKCGPLAVEQWRCDRCGLTLPEQRTPPPWWSSVPSSGDVHLVDCEQTTS
jgi:hypothetical protein